MSESKNIVTVTTAPAPQRSYPCGFAAVDEAAGNNGALRSGEVFTITGPGRSGRTRTLLSLADALTASCGEREVVLIAVVENTPQQGLQRPEIRNLPKEQLDKVRVAHVRTAAELAMMTAIVAGSGETPIALLVDDVPCLGDADGRYDIGWKTLPRLARGDLATAVTASTQLPFGTFRLPPAAAHVPPMVVAATARITGTRLPASGAEMCDAIVDVSGALLKSRNWTIPGTR